jgi:hypothetical protein
LEGTSGGSEVGALGTAAHRPHAGFQGVFADTLRAVIVLKAMF